MANCAKLMPSSFLYLPPNQVNGETATTPGIFSMMPRWRTGSGIGDRNFVPHGHAQFRAGACRRQRQFAQRHLQRDQQKQADRHAGNGEQRAALVAQGVFQNESGNCHLILTQRHSAAGGATKERGRAIRNEHPEIGHGRGGMNVKEWQAFRLQSSPCLRVPPCAWKIFAERDEVGRRHGKGRRGPQRFFLCVFAFEIGSFTSIRLFPNESAACRTPPPSDRA